MYGSLCWFILDLAKIVVLIEELLVEKVVDCQTCNAEPFRKAPSQCRVNDYKIVVSSGKAERVCARGAYDILIDVGRAHASEEAIWSEISRRQRNAECLETLWK